MGTNYYSHPRRDDAHHIGKRSFLEQGPTFLAAVSPVGMAPDDPVWDEYGREETVGEMLQNIAVIDLRNLGKKFC
jgi:hypothetical protein